jgi:hypothetical protein
MKSLTIGAALLGLTMGLGGCSSSGRPAQAGEKAQFTLVNNAGRPLSIQPMVAHRAAAALDSESAKGKPVKLFEQAGQMSGTSSQYVLYVVEKANDLDETVVSVIRLSPEEMAFAEKSGPVKISLEPNKVFVKFGTRFKTYEYTTKPAIAGEMKAPEAKKEEPAKK